LKPIRKPGSVLDNYLSGTLIT